MSVHAVEAYKIRGYTGEFDVVEHIVGRDLKEKKPLSVGYWSSLVIANVWFASVIFN